MTGFGSSEEKEQQNRDLVLVVDSAIEKDIAKGIARIDDQAMQVIGILPNDIVEIQGKRKTSVRCLSLSPEQGETQTIRVDGLIRLNAGIKIDDRVRIKKIIPSNAIMITLFPLEPVVFLTEEFLQSTLEGLPVIFGDIVMIKYFGDLRTFRIMHAVPELTTLIITRNTKINIMPTKINLDEYADYSQIFHLDISKTKVDPVEYFRLPAGQGG